MDNLSNTTTDTYEDQGLADGVIIGVSVGVVIFVVVIVLITVCCLYKRYKANGPMYGSGNGMNNQQTEIFPDRKASQHTTKPANNNSLRSNNFTGAFPDTSAVWSSNLEPGLKESSGSATDEPGSHHTKGLDNPAFCGDETQSVKPKAQSSQVVSTLERRKNRMDSSLAAVIAAERDRNTSVFSIYDADTLVDSEAVIVSDQRTAL